MDRNSLLLENFTLIEVNAHWRECMRRETYATWEVPLLIPGEKRERHISTLVA